MSRTETESSHEMAGIVHPTERDWEETLAATPPGRGPPRLLNQADGERDREGRGPGRAWTAEPGEAGANVKENAGVHATDARPLLEPIADDQPPRAQPPPIGADRDSIDEGA